MHIQSKTHASGKQVNNRRNISPNVPASKKQQGSERAACRQAGRRQRQRFGNQPHPTAQESDHIILLETWGWTGPNPAGAGRRPTPRTGAGSSQTRRLAALRPAHPPLGRPPQIPAGPAQHFCRSARRPAAARVVCDRPRFELGVGAAAQAKAGALFAAADTRPKRRQRVMLGGSQRRTPSAGRRRGTGAPRPRRSGGRWRSIPWRSASSGGPGLLAFTAAVPCVRFSDSWRPHRPVARRVPAGASRCSGQAAFEDDNFEKMRVWQFVSCSCSIAALSLSLR